MNVIKVIEQRIISKYSDQHFIFYISHCFSKYVQKSTDY